MQGKRTRVAKQTWDMKKKTKMRAVNLKISVIIWNVNGLKIQSKGRDG